MVTVISVSMTTKKKGGGGSLLVVSCACRVVKYNCCCWVILRYLRVCLPSSSRVKVMGVRVAMMRLYLAGWAYR